MIEPESRHQKIDSVYVIVVEDEDGLGGEGVPAAGLPNGMLVPLIAGDEQRLRQIIPLAQDICAIGNKEFVVRKFTDFTDVTDAAIAQYGRPDPPDQFMDNRE